MIIDHTSQNGNIETIFLLQQKILVMLKILPRKLFKIATMLSDLQDLTGVCQITCFANLRAYVLPCLTCSCVWCAYVFACLVWLRAYFLTLLSN